MPTPGPKGPNDTATLVTSAGNDEFGGVPSFSFVSGANYDSYAIGFANVDAYPGGAGSIAYLGMTPTGTDTFYGLPSYSAVTGQGYAVYAVGFHQTQGYAGGPNRSPSWPPRRATTPTLVRQRIVPSAGQVTSPDALGFAHVYAYAGGTV